jgi:hypothetical protein
LWRAVAGRRRCRSSRTLIVCLIPPQPAAGREALTVLRPRRPFSARPSPAWLIGWIVLIWLLMKRGHCLG